MAQPETETAFPPIPDRPVMPFVKSMGDSERARYEQKVGADMGEDTAGIVELMRSPDDFSDVSDETIGYVALRLATALQARFDQGVQTGLSHETPTQRWNSMLASRVPGNPMG